MRRICQQWTSRSPFGGWTFHPEAKLTSARWHKWAISTCFYSPFPSFKESVIQIASHPRRKSPRASKSSRSGSGCDTGLGANFWTGKQTVLDNRLLIQGGKPLKMDLKPNQAVFSSWEVPIANLPLEIYRRCPARRGNGLAHVLVDVPCGMGNSRHRRVRRGCASCRCRKRS